MKVVQNNYNGCYTNDFDCLIEDENYSNTFVEKKVEEQCLDVTENECLTELIDTKEKLVELEKKYENLKIQALKILKGDKNTLEYKNYFIGKRQKTTISYDEEIAKPILQKYNLWSLVVSINPKKMQKVLKLNLIPKEQVKVFTIIKRSEPFITVTAKDKSKGG